MLRIPSAHLASLPLRGPPSAFGNHGSHKGEPWLPGLQSRQVKTLKLDRVYAAAHDLRKTIPPADLSSWKPAGRKQTVEELIKASLKDRLPELTSVRFARMSASAFGFFRGSASVMAYDLALGPRTGVLAQLCGDAHVQNLGAFEGQDGRLIFDINDFDETIGGPFEWDLKRMATSILLAGREARLKPVAVDSAASQFLTSYGAVIRTLLPMPVLDVARFQVHRLGAVASISKILVKAQRATPLLSLQALTTEYPKGRVFKNDPPLLHRIEGAEREEILASFKLYVQSLAPERRHFFTRFSPIDVAFKVVGTGSVGLRAYVIYMEGNGPSDPLFLQIKQEVASCFSPYLSHDRKMHQGRRVVEGQRAMQIQSDPLLGWTRIGKYDFLVRQLSDHKASVVIDSMKPNDLCQYAAVCGEILARGHARSGDVRQIAGYLGNGRRFNQAIHDFASAYAKQMEADWKTFARSNGNGKKLPSN